MIPNIDVETGIRYGVISVHSVCQAWCDSSEPYFPCGQCEYEEDPEDRDYSDEVENPDDPKEIEDARNDYYQEKEMNCGACEPISHYYEEEGYQAESCLDNDIMIMKSPYYTFGRYCSPCVPGAVDLDSPDKQGQMAYCFGHDWFDGGKASYPVYRVSDHKEIFAWNYLIKYSYDGKQYEYQITVYGANVSEAAEDAEKYKTDIMKKGFVNSMLRKMR